MQFAHSGSETEKTASTAPRTSLWRHSGRTPQRRIRTIPWRSAAFAPSTTPASPHSAVPTPFHTIAPVPLHDAGYASSHHTAPVPFRNAAPMPLHGAVSISTHGAAPAPYHAAKPHAAHSTALGASPPPSALLQSCRKSGNKKVIKIATGADSAMSQSPNGGKSRDELIAATRRAPMNDART